MKSTALTALNPYASTEVSSDTIGVVVQTERVESHTLGGFSYGAPYTKCYAAFHGEPLEPLSQQKLPSHLQPKRALIVLRPNQRVKVKVERPLGSIGSYVFKNTGGRLQVRPAWRIWSRKLEMCHTGECDITPIV